MCIEPGDYTVQAMECLDKQRLLRAKYYCLQKQRKGKRYHANGSHCEAMAVLACPKPIPKVNLVPRFKHNTAIVGFTRVSNQENKIDKIKRICWAAYWSMIREWCTSDPGLPGKIPWYWARTHGMPAMIRYLYHWTTAAPGVAAVVAKWLWSRTSGWRVARSCPGATEDPPCRGNRCMLNLSWPRA
ncbi:hypothetical protein TNCV_2543111 [Trichonephila clavipes]|nr:hypothetical protein TNCV_2543111 [Trichonephila clavipes]